MFFIPFYNGMVMETTGLCPELYLLAIAFLTETCQFEGYFCQPFHIDSLSFFHHFPMSTLVWAYTNNHIKFLQMF